MNSPRQSAIEMVTYSQRTTSGETIRMCARTAAHLDYTKERLAGWSDDFEIIQGTYNTGVNASAGTHDRDCCLDVRIEGMGWLDAQWELRKAGWAAWYRRETSGLWIDHIHMISLGYQPYNIPVGYWIPGQVTDYYNHATGLSGQHEAGSDHTRHPESINATIFDYEEWIAKEEEDVPYREWAQADKAALMDDIAQVVNEANKSIPTKVWAFIVQKKEKGQEEKTAREALRESSNK